MNDRATRSLGFFDGARALFGGVRFVVTTPRVWPLAAVPAMLALVLVTGTTALGFVFGDRALARALPDTSTAAIVAGFLGRVLLFFVSAIVGLFVGLSLAQPLAAPALDAIAKRRAVALGITQFPTTTALAQMARSLRVVLVALAVGLPIVLALSVITLLVPAAAPVTVPLKFVVVAWLAAWDVFDYAFGLGGLGVRARLVWLRRHAAAAFAFGLAFSAVALVPGLGLFVLPMGVAGSTQLWAASSRSL